MAGLFERIIIDVGQLCPATLGNSMETWDRDSIRSLLMYNDKAVKKAVIAIYNRQTASEKQVDSAIVQNGEGFGAGDAVYLSKIARKFLAGADLPSWEFYKVRQRILKYAGQLVIVATDRNLAAMIKGK